MKGGQPYALFIKPGKLSAQPLSCHESFCPEHGYLFLTKAKRQRAQLFFIRIRQNKKSAPFSLTRTVKHRLCFSELRCHPYLFRQAVPARRRMLEPSQHIFKFQPGKQLVSLRSKKLLYPGFFPVKLHRTVYVYRCQRQTQIGKIFIGYQRFPYRLLRHLIHMLVQVIQCGKLLQKLCCSLFSDLRNSRDIVRSISHQRLQLDKADRGHSILFLYVRSIIILHFSTRSFCFGNAYLYLIRGYLQKVSVPGDKGNVHPLFFRSLCQRPQYIVRLQTRLLHRFDAHGMQHILQHRYLLAQLLRHRLSCTFIFLKNLMPESRSLHIKRHRQIIRLLFVQQLEQDI